MRDSFAVLTLQRAAQIVGDNELLANRLGVSSTVLDAWLRGDGRWVYQRCLLGAADIVMQAGSDQAQTYCEANQALATELRRQTNAVISRSRRLCKEAKDLVAVARALRQRYNREAE